MKILYISSLCSDRLLEKLFATSEKKPIYSAQKFHNLLAKGLCINNASIETLSAIPTTIDRNRKKIWRVKKEKEGEIIYHYIPFVNIPYIRQLCIFIYSFIYILYWSLKNKDGKVICDVLNFSLTLSLTLSSALKYIHKTGIVTDLPGFMVDSIKTYSTFDGIVSKLSWYCIRQFDAYVLLTEHMNKMVNNSDAPYIVMEGVVDINMEKSNCKKENSNVRNIIYAGGLYEEYGVKNLLDAFILVKGDNLRLSIYGDGPLAAKMQEYMEKDRRILFHGAVPNNVIVKEELKATLLVNPRPTNQEFVKYSFPSKNMEYMVSGTPVLTTRLPGMPYEYNSYVYTIDEENIHGIYEALCNVINLPDFELSEKGEMAKMFVLKYKNNIIQGRRIIELILSN